MNKIIIGSYTFTDADLMSGSIAMEHSVIGETLSADSLVFVVNTKHTGNHKLLTNSLQWYTTSANQGFVIADSSVESLPYATPASYYINDVLVGQFFTSKIERTGRDKFKITCTSSVGLLITSEHLGGIYTGSTAASVLASILAGVTYTLDANLANAIVRGYLPVATRRDNLQQVLFAIGGAVKINATGGLEIVQMSPTITSEIDSERIYLGGSIETKKSYSGVKLTEHNYFQTQEVETLFDDTIEGNQLVTFKEPHHGFSITGGTIVESGANYAIVGPPSGSQYGAVTLTGKKYLHTQRVITRGNAVSSGSSSVMQVSAATLANPEIAEELADRVWNFAQHTTYIKESIVVGSERAGDVVKIMNPYTYESVEAVVTNMDITMSKTNKASAKFLVGYTPEGIVSGFQHYAMLTGAGTWSKTGDNLALTQTSGSWIIDGETVTGTQNLGDVDLIRFILIGGGSGGTDGSNGTNGSAGSWSEEGAVHGGSNVTSYGSPGTGGNAGTAGNGGTIFELSVDIENSNSGAFTIGAGGVDGAEGGATTISHGIRSYSSANGKKYPYGYYEAKSQLTFANKGETGVKGADGGSVTGWGVCTNGGDTEVGQNRWVGGSSLGAHTTGRENGAYYNTNTYAGLGGGGAAYGANGGNATRGGERYSINSYAGNGANAVTATQSQNYGAGGNAGNGGGGGGSGSVYYHLYSGTDYWTYYYGESGGTGGSGSQGNDGNKGCLIIYF